MTTGTKTIGTPPVSNPATPNASLFYRQRQWTGGDGKYNTNGTLRWNNYDVTIIETNVQLTSSGTLLNDTNAYEFWDAGYDARLQNKLVQAVKGHEFHLGIFLGEGRQAAKMVVGNLQRIGYSLLHLRRGNFAEASKALGVSSRPTKLHPRDIAGRWLELQYGWLPLLSDVYNSQVAYSKLANEPRVWEFRVTQSTGKRTISRSESPGSALWKLQYGGNARTIGTIVYRMKEQLTVARSLGLTDPVAVAWELVPYSFVFDWFLPIGTYLENLNVIPNLTGEFLTTTISRSVSSLSTVKHGTGYGLGGKSRHERLIVKRRATTGLTAAFPTFIGLEDAMSPKRILNAIALVAQRSLGKATPPRISHRAIVTGSSGGGKRRVEEYGTGKYADPLDFRNNLADLLSAK